MEGFTFGQKKDKPERLSPNLKPFGQKKQKSGRKSPNLMPFRTEEAEIRENVSELEAPSDRRSRNRGERVRT